jgi:hypothetical protein
MSERRLSRPRHGEGIISAVGVGFFFILIGAIFVMTPNIFDGVVDFFKNFGTVKVPNTEIYLPAPMDPSRHLTVYNAVGTFCLIWGIFQIILLVFRFAIFSPYGKKAESVSNAVGWLGAYYLVITFLNDATTRTSWFAFWSTILMWLGFSLIVRAIILVANR